MKIRDWEVENRWAKGISHNPDAEKLAKLIGDVDFFHFNDYFCFSFGGDGDNGETLIYILDELIDRGIVEIKIIKE